MLWVLSCAIEIMVLLTTVFYDMATRYEHNDVCSIIKFILCVIMLVQVLILFIIILICL